MYYYIYVNMGKMSKGGLFINILFKVVKFKKKKYNRFFVLNNFVIRLFIG